MRLQRFFVRIDKVKTITEAHAPAFFDLLSDLGGEATVLWAAGALFIEFFAHEIYIANFMQNVFTIKSKKPRSLKSKDPQDLAELEMPENEPN